MLSAEVVLADGRSVMTSKVRHPDLFWVSTASAANLTDFQAIRGGGSSFGVAHSFVFRTHPVPDTVVYYELSLRPRSLPSSEEAVERATNLFLAFQEYGSIAPARLGMSWHVTPEPDGKGGYGTKVEILGQWMGSEEEYEAVMTEFEEVIERRGVGEFQRGQRSLSESDHWIQGNALTPSVFAVDAERWWKLDSTTRKRTAQHQRTCQLLCQGRCAQLCAVKFAHPACSHF